MNPAVEIQYGIEPRLRRRRQVARLLLTLALVAGCVAAVRISMEKLKYRNRDGLQRELESIAGVRVVGIDGYEDAPFTWKVVQARITVGGNSAKTITLRAPGSGQLRKGEHLNVFRIGPHFLSATYPDGTWPDCIDLGSKGPFATLLPSPLRDVDDLVARYDEVLAFIGTLPADGPHRGPDGKDYVFHRR